MQPLTSQALFAAVLKLSLMTVGWMPRSSSSCAFFSSAPQITTTDVVPSPATTSCRFKAHNRMGQSELEGAGKQMGQAETTKIAILSSALHISTVEVVPSPATTSCSAVQCR